LPKAGLYNAEMTLGNRIKAARERLRPKPTQAEIGAHFGVTDKAVSGWERDEAIPELDKIAKLSRLLRIPVIWLLEGTDDPPPPDSLEKDIEQLQPHERAVVRTMVDAFSKNRDTVA
jgi:transcriptional regulator with XRE-family HTH domain